MVALTVPAEGFTLSGASPTNTELQNRPPQVIQLDLAQKELDDLLKILRAHDGKGQITFGKAPVMLDLLFEASRC